jgi:septum formation protein
VKPRRGEAGALARKLVLASSSPRREALLREAGFKFSVVQPKARENASPRLSVRKFAEAVALKKALSVAPRAGDAVVIGADTIVALGGSRLGKPKGGAEAARMLKRISGRRLAVYSGLAAIDAKTGRKAVRSEKTILWMKKLDEDDIISYVRTGEPVGKAGGFALQGLGGALVSRVEGSRSNVIGLPLAALREALEALGSAHAGRG